MRGSLVAKGIVKSFPVRSGNERLPVIAGIDLTVAPGEFVAIVGPSGCGKSTLLDLLAGFEKADQGVVTRDGARVDSPTRSGVLVPQQSAAFPWFTVQTNLLLVQETGTKEEKLARAAEYIGIVGLDGFDQAFPYELSGGMRQRLEVARALIVKPDFLFMDEPFGALDALTRVRIRAELLQILLRERHTTILVTHDVDEALGLADRVIVLSPRPARIERIIAVDEPHPRVITSSKLVEMKARILEDLGAVPKLSMVS